MSSEKIRAEKIIPWIFAAVVPTAVQLTAGASWLSVLLVSLIGFLFVLVSWNWGEIPSSKVYAVVMWSALVLLLGMLSKESIKCWPEEGHTAVAIILLALALWSAWKGAVAASAVGCVIFWFVLILYSLLYIEGANEIQIEWLKPARSDTGVLGCLLLLTPVVASLYLKEKKKEKLQPKYLLVILFPVLAAILTNGILSPAVSKEKENAFYEMTRSLTLLGQAKRFEAVLAAASAMGWFSLMSLYLNICGKVAQIVNPNWGRKGITIAAALAGVYTVVDLAVPEIPMLILTVVLWGLVPILAWGMGQIKKS